MTHLSQSELDKVFSDDFEKKLEEKKPEVIIIDEPEIVISPETLKIATEQKIIPTKKEDQKQAQQKKNDLMTMEIKNGSMVVSTMEQKVEMIKAAIKANMLPSRYQDVGSVLAGLQYSSEIGLGGTLVSLRQIAVVKGTPTIFGDLPLSICQSKGMVESIREYYLDKDQKEISVLNKNLNNPVEYAVCEIKRIGDPEKIVTFFSMNEAIKADLLRSDVWKKYTKLMLKYRARSEAIKSKFADCINGISIGEYDFNGIDEKTSNIDLKQSNKEINSIVFKEED